jgi:hypothetical protein
MSEPQAETESTPVLPVHESATAATVTQAAGDDDPNTDARFMEFVSHSLGGMIVGHLTSAAEMLPLGPNGERVMISSQFTNLRTLAGQLRVLASLIDARLPQPKQPAPADLVTIDHPPDDAAEPVEQTFVHS